MGMDERSSIVMAARSGASSRFFSPAATIKCRGIRVFRSRMARDLACLFDTNPDIAWWACMPTALEVEGVPHVPDFWVVGTDGIETLYDASDRAGLNEASLRAAAVEAGWVYRRVHAEEVYDGWRLRNARDLLRYGEHECTLGDRVRLLAALDDAGTLTFHECLQLIREAKPVAGLASLILREFVEADLDEGLICPETTVRRIRR